MYWALSVQRKGLELNDEGRQGAEGRQVLCVMEPPHGCVSTHVQDRQPRVAAASLLLARNQHNGSRLEPQVSTTLGQRLGPHTHSCIERLQYSMCRGVPFRLNWTTV